MKVYSIQIVRPTKKGGAEVLKQLFCQVDFPVNKVQQYYRKKYSEFTVYVNEVTALDVVEVDGILNDHDSWEGSSTFTFNRDTLPEDAEVAAQKWQDGQKMIDEAKGELKKALSGFITNGSSVSSVYDKSISIYGGIKTSVLKNSKPEEE